MRSSNKEWRIVIQKAGKLQAVLEFIHQIHGFK